MKWRFWKRKEIAHSVEWVNLKETDLLVFRLGTELLPAHPEAIRQFAEEIEEHFKKKGIKAPALVVSTLVQLTAVNVKPYGKSVLETLKENQEKKTRKNLRE